MFYGLAQTPEAQGGNCIGRTVLNDLGGNTSTDGLKVIMSGAGNLQVVRMGVGNIYNGTNYIPTGTSNVHAACGGGNNNICLSIGSQTYKSNYLASDIAGFSAGGYFTVVSNTCQSTIAGPNQQNIVRLLAVKNGLNYYLNVKYDYTIPNDYLTITYTVEIPAGNTEVVKLANYWDTYLLGGDQGPGFVNGVSPNLLMGVSKPGAFEAFNFVSGVPWSGYYSGFYNNMNVDLTNDMIFGNYIDNTPTTDNGIGISINFGSTPGTFSSVNNLSFSCDAGIVAPSLSATTISSVCPATTVNLNSLLSGTVPSGALVKWYTNNAHTGTALTTPTAAGTGTYYAFYQDINGGCFTPASNAVTVNIPVCCQAGTTAPPLTATTLTNVCPATTINLNGLHTAAVPSGATLVWFTNNAHTGTAVATPSAATAGTYYAFYFDAVNNCYSPASIAVNVTTTSCCDAVAPTLSF